MREIIGRTLLAVCLLCVFVACDKDEDTPVNPSPTGSLTITGTVQFKKNISVPSSAILSGVWVVSSGSPDYAYMFGRGTVNFGAGTFSITFDNPPPTEALNSYAPSRDLPPLGVGVIVLGDFASATPHKMADDEGQQFYGAVSNIGIIYIGGDPAKYNDTSSSTDWPKDFPSGYGVGEGVDMEQTFDIFVPIPLRSFILTITDDPADITFPDWT